MPPRLGSSPAVFVGLATWDTIALVPGFPEPDGRVVAEAIAEAGGGPAATGAVACARLGVAASFIGTVGDDARGTRILDGLRAEGVDVSAAIVVPGALSAAAVIVADRLRGTRAICPIPSPPLNITAGSAQASRIAAAAMVHVDQAGYAPAAALGDATVPLSVDAGNPIAGLDLSRIRLFAPTQVRLAALVGDGTVTYQLRRAAGPDWVVATAGAAGAHVRAAGKTWLVPAWRDAPCISTLGAGDVFHGALVAAWIRGFEPPDATAYASIAAGLSCCGVDGRSAIPNHDTVMRLLPAHVAATSQLMEV